MIEQKTLSYSEAAILFLRVRDEAISALVTSNELSNGEFEFVPSPLEPTKVLVKYYDEEADLDEEGNPIPSQVMEFDIQIRWADRSSGS